MKKSKTVQMALMVAAWLLAGGAWAAEVKNVTAKYQWPWGVGISYEVTGTIGSDVPLVVKAVDRMKGATYIATASALSGDTGTDVGKHQLVWDLDKQGVNIQSTNVTFTVTFEWPLYCVVDVSGGANASSYSVTYLNEPPGGGFNTDVYKTTNLVLRKVSAGSFTMGSPAGESGRDSDETQHKVTLSKPYYIGVFPVTEKQWFLVTGSYSPDSYGVTYPVQAVSWNTIRGNTNWPTSSTVSTDSFMGRLRARTGLEFDLPTEAQWEYACRAGTTTAYSYGPSANGNYMWYTSNSTGARAVGKKSPNAWELYDMHGNVWELCLDWYVSNLGTAAVTDPKGPLSGAERVVRGGCGNNDASYCRSACRGYSSPSRGSYLIGFRLSRPLSAE